ncbi:MAG: restriction endonuclease subunit M [Chloroflexi bacterium CFX1]|nr:restriction endonuclease subunit M [Chloroflexi bacterium CFX1]MCQ3954000.1 restriction endonuclease subunit M [Chloroflexota bacterium]MDL1919887.1 restriction endonuclease subunit M [Chloroflexi bacterium CFX5]NUQ60252.1 N-6 DNA methylase [Anaerolineales bacterium]
MTSHTAALAIIQKLVETFEQNLDSYRSSKNETELRREFLDKFFTALGWDVSNEKGDDESNKEVVHEFSVEVAGQGKKADYAFRASRENKNRFDFLVEAKKPSVKIESSQDAAFQLRRYGWSAKLPINILTDFEHFAVYDCRAKPSYNDKVSFGRIMLVHYKEYEKRWEEIVKIFSPEAVRNGSLAKYADGLKGKKGADDVDDAFLHEIERWRESLAKNIALRNETIDIAGLNYAVQMTIDRIVFLRICEERGIEPENQLQDIADKDGIYDELRKLFKRADTKYNSGLFHFRKEKESVSRPDDLTLSLTMDDRVLKDIISNLYYPKSPYAFLYIPSDILGQVYERFLGKVIRLTAGHQAKVEEKPEVRKAGGVYYTPTYIVEYIVKNTVGKLTEGKTPKEIASLKIVDPACGSGTFLLGAYQFLMDWHLNWYTANDPEKWAGGKSPAVYQAVTYQRRSEEKEDAKGRRVIREGIVDVKGEWRLTTAKRKEILLNNIHGVDVDSQAVEVTKLSLLLKMLENANGQLGLGMERILPDLGNNIKYGNSLIGPDYFDGKLFADPGEFIRVNPFDWGEGFKEVFANGGFDVAIGNPPYGASFTDDEELYFASQYKTFGGTKDLYTCFIEKTLSISKQGGRLSYIVPSGWTGGPQYKKLRDTLLSQRVENLLLLPFDIFEDAYVDTLIYVIEKNPPADNHLVSTYTYPKREKIVAIEDLNYKLVRQKDWETADGSKFVLDPDTIGILQKLTSANSRTLGDVCLMRRGVLFDSDLLVRKQASKNHFRYFEGDVYRYQINLQTDRWVEFSDKLKERPKEFFWFENERILLRRLVNRRQRLMACVTDLTFITNKNLYSIIPQGVNAKFLLGVLNSRLLSFLYIKQVTQAVKDDFPQVTIKDVLSLPFPPSEKVEACSDKMISLVGKALALHISLSAETNPGNKETLERQIETTDKAIDSLVYELYGLGGEEIKIVEDGLSNA